MAFCHSTVDMELEVPRDRQGDFEPQLVKKGEKQLNGFDDRTISQFTNAVMEEVQAWQSRPLDAIYPIVYLDALVVRSRASGAVQNKSVYLALGINMDGEKELLGLWMAETEGAKFWLSVMAELKKPRLTGYLYRLHRWTQGFSRSH